MKKIISILILLQISLAVNCQILVPSRKKALLMKMTATWCKPCGDYHAITEHIYSQHNDSIVFINAHVATSSVGDAFSGEFHNALNGGNGIPAYNVNGILQPSWPPSESAIIDSARSFLRRPVRANLAFTSKITGNQLTVDVRAKFFTAMNYPTAEYFINVFIVENNITTQQQVGTATGVVTMIQDRVSRGPMSGGNAGMWGQKIANGNIASNSFFNASFTSTLKASWVLGELRQIAVLWQKIGTQYIVLSAEDIPSSTTSILENEIQENELSVYPNPASKSVTINFPVNTVGYTLYNALGEAVLINNDLKKSTSPFVLSLLGLSPGIYYLNASCPQFIPSKKYWYYRNNCLENLNLITC